MFASRLENVKPSTMAVINDLANQLIAEGKPVLKFAIGAPDFKPAKHVKEAAKEAIDKGESSYTAAGGIPELKQAICDKFKRENSIEYSDMEVMASAGAKQVLYNICQTILNPKDEVIVPQPTWETHSVQVQLAFGVPVFAKLPTDLKLRAELIEPLITEKTKMIIMNSPSNPTGAVMDPAEIEKVANLAVKHDLYLVSDEVYEHLLFDGAKHLSPASLSPEIKAHTLTVNSVSKTYALPGWRLGYVGGPANLIKAVTKLQGLSTFNPSVPAQFAAIAALNGPQDLVREMREEFDRRRMVAVKAWNSIPDISCETPTGAFYAFPNVSAYYKGKIKNSSDLAKYLLKEVHVALIPGSAFGADDYLRFSYASSMEDIREGMQRIKKALIAL